MTRTDVAPAIHVKAKRGFLVRAMRTWELYLFLIPTLLYFAIFHYGPLYGIQIAFRDYMGALGIWGSPWVGFEHFLRFFKSVYFVNLLSNTLLLSLFMLVFSFPIPIIFALLLNQLRSNRYKRIVQTVSYAPHFISMVVFVGMLFLFSSPSTGIINVLVTKLGGPRIYYMGDLAWFRPLYVLSDNLAGNWMGSRHLSRDALGNQPRTLRSGDYRWSLEVPAYPVRRHSRDPADGHHPPRAASRHHHVPRVREIVSDADTSQPGAI